MKTTEQIRCDEKIEKYKAMIFSLIVTLTIVTTLLILVLTIWD